MWWGRGQASSSTGHPFARARRLPGPVPPQRRFTVLAAGGPQETSTEEQPAAVRKRKKQQQKQQQKQDANADFSLEDINPISIGRRSRQVRRTVTLRL